jgi:hypothetical protein
MHLHSLQQHAAEACRQVFGEANMTSKLERDLRFAEEAIELMHARGLGFSQVLSLMCHEYFERPNLGKGPGEVPQEIAGTLVTLLNLATVNEIDAEEVTLQELARILTNKKAIRAKHDKKPHIAVKCDEAA